MQDLGPLPEGAAITERLEGKASVVVHFTDSLADIEKSFPGLVKVQLPDGMIRIAWPKKASGWPTDLNENIVRETGLNIGLVDVKVCAINDKWSGLKFVVRLKDRPPKNTAKHAKKQKEQ